MTVNVRALLADQRARGLADLEGSRVDATVPIRQALVDELVGAVVSRYPQAELDVRLREGNRFDVRAGWRIFGFPARWRLPFAIEPHARLTERPVLFLRLAEPSATWSAARRAIGGLGLLPPFVRISDEGVALDLERLAQQHGVSDLLPIVRALSFDGRDDMLWMRVEAEVPRDLPAAASGRQEAGGARVQSGTAVRDPGSLVEHLAGARATMALRISERLVNEVLETGLESAKGRPTPTTQEDPGGRTPLDLQDLLEWCRAVRLTFEAGFLTISAEVLVGAPAS
jgi:hypothetical protein